MKEYKLDIDSDFYQIIISDEEWEGLDGPTDWTEKNLNNFAISGTYVAGLKVVENDNHKLSVVLHDEPILPNLDNWEHIVDIPFEAPTGILDIQEESIEIPPGKYIIRWSIKKISAEEAEYHIDMWEGEIEEVTVIKQMEL